MNVEVFAALVGVIVGGVVTWFFSTLQRNSEKWKLFQEEIGIIKSKFCVIKKTGGIQAIESVRADNLEGLVSAVCRVRPYIFCSRKRRHLICLLDDYRAAAESEKSGFVPVDLSGGYKGRPGDAFTEPQEPVDFLIGILNKMDAL